jgi:PAS domain S-box-containing protein
MAGHSHLISQHLIEQKATVENRCDLLAKLILVLITAIAAFLLPQSAAAAPVKEVRRVLILNVFEPLSSPGVALLDQSIVAELQKAPQQIELYSEDLQGTLFPDEASQQEFRRWYIHKYRERRPDLIIAVGLEPVKFMVESHDKFFAGIPIVFCGMTREMLGQMTLDSQFTGIFSVAQPEKTLQAALRLRPGTKHVVVTGGVGAYDRYLEAIAKESFRKYESSLDFTYLTDLEMPALLERLKHLPEHTIVYHTSIMQDAAGTHFIDAAQAVPMVASAANAPVFAVDDADIGNGTVGGDALSLAADGRAAGAMAVRVLNGEKPQDIPIAESSNVYMFDWRAMQRWGLSKGNLPPGSVLLHDELDIWEAYKWYIVVGIFLILAQTSLIIALVWQRTRRRKVETELAVTYDRLRMAMVSGKSVGWEWDLASGRDRWFGDLWTMFGIPSDTFDGRAEDFHRYLHPDDRKRVSEAVADARVSHKRYEAEFRVVWPNGTTRWVSASGSFSYARNGDPERMLGMAVDITEGKHAEEALRESEERLRLAVQVGRMYVDDWDSARDVIMRSPEYVDILGVDEPMQLTSRELLVKIHPDDREKVAAAFARLTPEDSSIDMLYRFLRSDGSVVWLEKKARAFFDDKGKLQRMIGVVVDITDRTKAEQALRESEERFRLVANTAPVLIWMSGTDKLCTYFNQSWLEFTGRPLEAELGNGWVEGVHPEDSNACLTAYTRAFDRRESFERQYRLRRHDGAYRWVSDIGVPRFNPDHSLAGYIGSAIDVTDRKLAGEALATMGRKLIEAHEEERTRIARELHDDINQRIALLAVELEQWNQHLPESAVDIHDHIHHARQRLSDIANDIQALSHRLHSSKLEYLGLVAAANSFCKEFSEQQKVRIEFSHLDVPRTIPREISLCLFRILQEAVQNAAKHSGARHFDVDLRGTAEGMCLTVRDQGVGFDWQSAENARGLGLISMKERLQLVNGELSVKSEPGRGTTISARVPFRAEEHLQSAAG